MDPLRLSGPQFTGLLESGEIHEAVLGSGARVVVVDGSSLPDRCDGPAEDRFQTLAALVVAAADDPEARRPDWADLVVAPESPVLDSVLDTVGTNPLAATTLAILLRTGRGRTIAQGLVAESTAYGLVQAGPEFALWRRHHPPRVRTDPAGPAVVATRRDHVLSITLDRPHVLNAFDARMRDDLVAALQVAAVDPTVTSVVVRGAGRSFCSGGDLDEFGSRPDPVTAHLVRLGRSAGRALAEVAAKTTVHLHGAAVGSGIELAAFSGRVVADPSTTIALPEVRMGLIPGAGGTVSLPRRIGRHATLLLAVGPASIDAVTALRWGLVDELGP